MNRGKEIYASLMAAGFGAFFAMRLSAFISGNIISTISAVMLLVGILGTAVTKQNKQSHDEEEK